LVQKVNLGYSLKITLAIGFGKFQENSDMAFQVAGKLHKVFPTEQKTEKFQAREFVIEISESQYPQMIKFQLTQEKCELIDEYGEGEEITVHFDLRGREWNEKYFTNLNAWKLERGANQPGKPAAANPAQAAYQPAAAPPAATKAPAQPDFDDDIPF